MMGTFQPKVAGQQNQPESSLVQRDSVSLSQYEDLEAHFSIILKLDPF